MKVIETGRFVTPPHAAAARRFLRESLLSLHGRRTRLQAIAGMPPAPEREAELNNEMPLALAQAVAGDPREWIILRDYAGLRQRNLVFLFKGADHPSLIVKTRPIGAPGPSLEIEGSALRTIRSVLPEPIRATLQEVVSFDTIDGHEVLALTALRGRPLDISMQRSLRPRARHAAHLAAAGRWLGTFHAATRRGREAFVHGDFWPRNLLFEAERLTGVVDWEHARLADEPWEDVFTLPFLFATTAPSWVRRRDAVRDFRGAFTGRGAVASAVAGYFQAYAAHAGIDPAALRRAFEEFLLEQAHRGRAEETAWKRRYPWPVMLRIVQGSPRTVFSA